MKPSNWLTVQVVDTFRQDVVRWYRPRRRHSGSGRTVLDAKRRTSNRRCDYVLYREERKRMRSEKVEAPSEEHPEIRIAKEDGTKEPLDDVG